MELLDFEAKEAEEDAQAVRTTLHAHGMISLCLDRRPSLEFYDRRNAAFNVQDVFGSIDAFVTCSLEGKTCTTGMVVSQNHLQSQKNSEVGTR